MTTVALSTTPATLDPGTAYEILVVNSGAVSAHVQINGGLLYDERVKPGQTVRVPTSGNAVTAYVRSGTGQVDVTITAATNPQGAPSHESGQLDAATARSTYRSFPKIADLPSPIIAAHRGAGMLGPENTLEGLRLGAGLPNVGMLDAGDFRDTRDGGVVAIHDATVDAKTSLTGNVNNFTLPGLRRTPICDVSYWFGGGWPDTYVPTARQIISEFGGQLTIQIEPKTAVAATRLAALVSATGIGPSVMFTGADVSLAAPGVAAGAVGSVFYTSAQVGATTAAAIVSTLAAAGISHVQVQHGSDTAKIAALIAAGLNVWVYDLFRQSEFATYAGMGLRGYFVDDPLYAPDAAGVYRKTSVSWTTSGTWGRGHLNLGNNVDPSARGSFVGSAGAYRWAPINDVFCLIGEVCPVANAASSYTLTVPITFDALPSDMTKWAGFTFGAPTDSGYNNGIAGSGNTVIMRANGDAALYRVTNGASVQIGSTSAMPDFTAGTTVILTIAVTPTGITITRSDAGPSITTTDTTYRGGYIHAGMSGYSTGLRCSFGALSVA